MTCKQLPSDEDFELLRQKLEQFRQLLIEIDDGIKNGDSVKQNFERLTHAKLLCNECKVLKRDIKSKIDKNIN